MTTAANLNARLMVGLEIHVELATRSKMFTSAPNVAHRDYHSAEPNTLLSPIVVGLPGSLPVINKRAVEMSILVGLALDCKIARQTKWDRKSYYYPDLPKNYQISQYDQPLCYDGLVVAPVSDGDDAELKPIRIIRAHLEEDAGKLLHEAPAPGSRGSQLIDASIVDLNRAGTPLLEIVTEPDFESADQVVAFAQMLRNICRHLSVTEGIMQMGHMRFEPNINVVIDHGGKTYKTPIVEIKNLNSFRAVRGAIAYEYQRQIDQWLETGQVMGSGSKSTRGWDDVNQVTILQREKEEAHDYRYFPDPDLVPVIVSDPWLETIKADLIELPHVRCRRYIDELGLNVKDARQIIDEPATTRFFEAVLAEGVDAKRAAAMLLNYAAKRANEQGVTIDCLGITAQQVRQIADLADADKISSSAAADLFGYCCESDDTAEQIADTHGLMQVSDTGALDGFIDQVLADAKNAKAIEDIKAGKGKAIGALMGQIMKLSKGKANPKLVTEMIKQKLGA